MIGINDATACFFGLCDVDTGDIPHKHCQFRGNPSIAIKFRSDWKTIRLPFLGGSLCTSLCKGRSVLNNFVDV